MFDGLARERRLTTGNTYDHEPLTLNAKVGTVGSELYVAGLPAVRTEQHIAELGCSIQMTCFEDHPTRCNAIGGKAKKPVPR